MDSRWITDASEIDLERPWNLETPTERFLGYVGRFPTMLTEADNGDQIALVQGMLDPASPGKWLVQTAYFSDALSGNRLWLRSTRFHAEWVRCCQEISITECRIKFGKSSSVRQAYGKNIVSKMSHIYSDVHWDESDSNFSFLNFDIPLG